MISIRGIQKKRYPLAAVLALVLFCSGCGSSKTPITVQEFTDKTEESGFVLVDAADQFEEGSVESVLLAVGENYQLEFYVLPSTDQASSAFSQNRETFESAAGSVSSHKSVSLGNYSYFYQTTSENFYLVSVIDSTMIYCVAPKDYADEIKTLVKELGYL